MLDQTRNSPEADLRRIVNAFPVLTIEAHAEQAMGQERLFHELLEALPAAIYTTDADGRITFFNKACVDFAGRTPEIGEMWCVTRKLFRPDGAPLRHEDCPMAVALKEQRSVRGVDAVAERPDGSRIHFTPYPTPLRDGSGRLVGAVNMLIDITARKQAEDRMLLLTREVDHRSNNLLAVIQAMLRLTKADTVEEFQRTFDGRLGALSNLQKLFSESRWAGANISDLINEELRPYDVSDQSRISIAGPHAQLPSALGQAVAIAIHELATNAAKYGSLSIETGKLEVRWQTDAKGALHLTWMESGGPIVEKPTRRGFGVGAIDSMIRTLNGKIARHWKPEGLICELFFPHADPATAGVSRSS